MVLEFAQQLAGQRPVRAKVREDGCDAYSYSVADDGGIDVESGTARGVLYAVYDVLDGNTHGVHTPVFSIRGLFECGVQQRYWTSEMVRRFIDRIGRWRMNTLPVITAHGYKEYADIIDEECAKRGIDIIHYTYYQFAFCDSVPREYFAVDANGNPKPQYEHLETNDRLCASNPEGLNLFRQGVRKYIKEHPDRTKLLFATPDGHDLCQCNECSKLGPVGQTMPFFEIFMQETVGGKFQRQWLTYYQRYKLPEDMSLIRNTEAIMYDTHIRNPFFPLHDPEMKSGRASDHEEVDTRAKVSTRNRYLFDRLKEWKEAYYGNIYIHENLMVHASLGVPRFNTPVYIEDLRQYRKLGIEGVVYEAYESGIRPFLPQLGTLARAMWEPDANYEFLDDANPELSEFYQLVNDWKNTPDWKSARNLMHYLMERPDRDEFDWLWIGFRTMQVAYSKNKLLQLSIEERELLESIKLWDYMEGRANARDEVGRLIISITAKLMEMP